MVLMTKVEVADRLRVSTATVDRLLADGKLRRVVIGRRKVMILAEDVERLIRGESVTDA